MCCGFRAQTAKLSKFQKMGPNLLKRDVVNTQRVDFALFSVSMTR